MTSPECRAKALECYRIAQQAADPATRHSLLNLAVQWRELCLNSFRVIAVKVGASRTPRWASSMIFDATSRVAGSSTNASANFAHTFSSASDICRINSGSNAWPARTGRIGTVLGYSRFMGTCTAHFVPLFLLVKYAVVTRKIFDYKKSGTSVNAIN